MSATNLSYFRYDDKVRYLFINFFFLRWLNVIFYTNAQANEYSELRLL